MPFTPAHAMAVLPGVAWSRALQLDPTCLVIGSMAPDFEYFARGRLADEVSHSWLGILVWGVPVTLALAAVLHRFVKWPALLAAPSALTPVFAAPWHARWTAGAVASAIVSAALGDVSHLVWDGFTHADGLVVPHVPALSRPYDLPIVGPVALYQILQHGSTVVGLAAITAYVLWRIQRTPRIALDVPRRRARIVFAACLAAGIAAFETRQQLVHLTDLGNQVVGTICGVLLGTLVASAILYRAGRRYQARVLDAHDASLDP